MVFVCTVEGGSIRSYRLFPKSRFRLAVLDDASRARFIEHMPDGLVLRYEDSAGGGADLRINLDIFEMLHRLNEGYRPTVEEMGFGRNRPMSFILALSSRTLSSGNRT